MKVLVIDNSAGNPILTVVKKYFSSSEIYHEVNRDISFKRIPKDIFDIVVSAEGIGRLSNDDIVSFIKESKMVKKPVIICIDRNPRVRANLSISLKPYRGFALNISDTYILEEILANITR